jgi:hypothetical protein
MTRPSRLFDLTRPAWLLLLASALAACAGAPERPSGPPPDAAARQLSAAGRHREAAQVWLKLAAQARKDTAQQYRLDAADSLVSADDRDGARKVLADAQARGVPATLRVKADLVTARLSLAEDRPEQALAALAGPYPDQSDRRDRWRAQVLRADAQVRLGRPAEAVRERVVADRFASSGSETSQNALAIWNLLSRVPSSALSDRRPAPPDPYGGWLELAALHRQYGRDPSALARALDGWRARYPRHPAALDVVPEILDMAKTRGGMPLHVALLLPEQGPFAAAARAVREGFIAGWFAQGAGPEVSFYDTGPGDLDGVLKQAVEDGADFVVGPLDKPSVSRLASGAAPPLPVLALNRADGGLAPPGEFYQFGLAPEEEARAVARRARADGFGRAALLFPDSDWGERAAAAFREAWGEVGGLVAAEGRLSNQAEANAAAVRAALGTGDGPADPRAAMPGSARSAPDVVLLAAFPGQARQVQPQIAGQPQGPLPVYATSHVYTGVPDPTQDRDLEGIIFADMPWVVSPSAVAPDLQRSFQESWPELRQGYNRLFAFGVDAYRLLPELTRLSSAGTPPVAGVTGQLSLDRGNRIVREPAWAQFRGGVPVAVAPPGEGR